MSETRMDLKKQIGYMNREKKTYLKNISEKEFNKRIEMLEKQLKDQVWYY